MHVHLHAVDDRHEVVALKRECTHRLREAEKRRWRRAAIDRIDVGAPALQLFAPRLARPQIVGDVVNGAAERIDFEHRFALRPRQNPHAAIKRAARGALGGL